MSKRCCGRWSRRAAAEGSFPWRFPPDEANGRVAGEGDQASYASEEGVRMSVKIRLMRRGATGQPFYRLGMAGAHATAVELRVLPDDLGKVIGRGGRVIKAIRTLARAAATRGGKRVTVEIVRPEGADRPSESRDSGGEP